MLWLAILANLPSMGTYGRSSTMNHAFTSAAAFAYDSTAMDNGTGITEVKAASVDTIKDGVDAGVAAVENMVAAEDELPAESIHCLGYHRRRILGPDMCMSPSQYKYESSYNLPLCTMSATHRMKLCLQAPANIPVCLKRAQFFFFSSAATAFQLTVQLL